MEFDWALQDPNGNYNYSTLRVTCSEDSSCGYVGPGINYPHQLGNCPAGRGSFSPQRLRPLQVVAQGRPALVAGCSGGLTDFDTFAVKEENEWAIRPIPIPLRVMNRAGGR